MNLVEILNTIRDNASLDYQSRIPEATLENLESIRYAMIGDDNIMVANEFMTSLLNKLVKSIVHTKMFENPLKSLKKGTKPLGDTIEEIYNNFIKGQVFDQTGAKLLSRKLPDTKTVYHRMNYKMQYPITVSREALSKAFMSYQSLETYINNIIAQLYNSAEFDEFANIKNLLDSAFKNKCMKKIPVEDPLISKTNAENFIKSIKTFSDLMMFPSTEYNAYLEAQSTDIVPITTLSRKDEQILILDAATNVGVSVDVLASAFNMSVVEFNDTRKIVIDMFPDPDIRAMLVDESFFQIYDDLFNITSFYNAQGLYTNYYLNVWQTQAYSILVNALAFTIGTDEDSDGSVETFSVTYTLADGINSSNTIEEKFEDSSYTTTLSTDTGVTIDTVTVTMGGVDVTSTAYTSATKKVKISSVTGNIVITATKTA